MHAAAVFQVRENGGLRLKIRYILPGVLTKTDLGPAEVARRQEKLRGWASPGTYVDVAEVDRGPATIESMYEEYLSVPASAECALRAQKEGFDAAIIGCFGDPGLDALRELCDMLVVGPAGASIAMASGLGHRFSIVTVVPGIVDNMRRLAWDAGAYDKLASVRAVDVSVLEINRGPDAALKRMLEVAAKTIEDDGAQVVVLGCMSMGFLDVAEKMTVELGVPVLNPVRVSLKVAEGLAACGLTHSRRAYLKPRKMAAGMRVEDLLVK